MSASQDSNRVNRSERERDSFLAVGQAVMLGLKRLETALFLAALSRSKLRAPREEYLDVLIGYLKLRKTVTHMVEGIIGGLVVVLVAALYWLNRNRYRNKFYDASALLGLTAARTYPLLPEIVTKYSPIEYAFMNAVMVYTKLWIDDPSRGSEKLDKALALGRIWIEKGMMRSEVFSYSLDEAERRLRPHGLDMGL